MKDKVHNEALFVQYLLGNLSEREQVEIEERAFQDHGYMLSIQSVETDLIDDYVRGELSECERRQFEARFLVSSERRRKVEFARALAVVTTESSGTEKNDIDCRQPAADS